MVPRLDEVAPPAQLADDVLAETAFELERPGPRLPRIERLRKVVGVEHRRVDRLLQAEPEVHEREEKDERPLVLPVAARSPERKRLTVAPGDRRRERRARALARLERARQPFLEPEHLAPGAEAEAETGNHGRAVQPAAARGRGDDVAVTVDHIDVARVAQDRLAGSGRRCGRGRNPRQLRLSALRAPGAQLTRRLLDDEPGALFRVAWAQQVAERNIGEGRVAVPRLAVRERELRALDHDVDELGALAPDRSEVETFEQPELLQEDRALAPRPRLENAPA